MDSVALHILCRELEDDARVLHEAAAKARERLDDPHPGHLEACGFEINRVYNVVEKAFERVCVAFENHFEKRGDYHERLIERVSLDLPGFRPAFLPAEWRGEVRDVKNFRHVFRHAYDLKLQAERLKQLVATVEKLDARFRPWIERFERAVPEYLRSPEAGP